MDTNSIQPAGTTCEVSTVSTSTSFTKWFIELTALGIWQVSLMSSCLATAFFLFIITLRFGTFSPFLIQLGLTSYFVSALVWIMLSRFRWPFALRVILSIWSAAAVGFMAATQFWHVLLLNSEASIAAILTNSYVIQAYLIPSVVIGLAALAPYVYREYLNNKTLLLKSDSDQLLEKRDDGG